MRKVLRTVSFAFCVFVTVAVFSKSGEWKEYVYAEDGFAISAPKKPDFNSSGPKDFPEAGKEIAKTFTTVHTYMVSLNTDSGLVVMYYLLSPKNKRTPEQVLAEQKKVFDDISIVSEKSITLGKYPGIEIEIERRDSHEKRRIYAVGRQVYVLAGLTRADKALPEDLQRWYDSFRLVGAQK
jgi:hypothetical protein